MYSIKLQKERDSTLEPIYIIVRRLHMYAWQMEIRGTDLPFPVQAVVALPLSMLIA